MVFSMLTINDHGFITNVEPFIWQNVINTHFYGLVFYKQERAGKTPPVLLCPGNSINKSIGCYSGLFVSDLRSTS